MAADMDIDMDLDVGLLDEDLVIPEIEIIPHVDENHDQFQLNGVGPNDTSGADALQPIPQKVHLRGLDDLTTKDIKSFASEYFAVHKPANVEWIDDTSANIVYETAEIAKEALLAFTAVEITDISQIPILQTIPAKPFPLHPQTRLEVRLAVLGDRKQAGARERSRFYLFNPEHDPAERRKRGGNRGNKYRDRDDGGYRSQRYDARENRKRQIEDEELGFDATLYDDDEAALAHRAARKKPRQDSASSGSESRPRNVRFRGAAGKELFPDRGNKNSGRLRDRSASPLRGSDRDQDISESQGSRTRIRQIAASENRESAQVIKSRLRQDASSKELFPHKIGVSHRRSGAFDAADATADLFAKQMQVPFLDDHASSLASRISTSPSDVGRLNIRGKAKASATQDFFIKGIAPPPSEVKELFPSGKNAGKELFSSERLVGRGQRRQKAEDLFS